MELPQAWLPIIDELNTEYHPVAMLLYGSRAPGWPDPPLQSSDYDVLAVREAGGRERSRRVASSGRLVDLIIVSKQGVRSGQLLTPETHVMLRYGTKLGDWSWLDPAVPLSWSGADDAAEEIHLLYTLAHDHIPEDPLHGCELAVKAVRKGLVLLSAIGQLAEAPTWKLAERRYGLSPSLITTIRDGNRRYEYTDKRKIAEWVQEAIQAGAKMLQDVTTALQNYPRNKSDKELLVSASGGFGNVR